MKNKRVHATLVSFILMAICIGGCGLNTDRPISTSACPSAMPVVSTLLTTPAPTVSSSPTPSPSPTVEPATPSPEPEETFEPEPSPTYDIPDIKNIGLTDEQYGKIEAILNSALFMNKEFHNTNVLGKKELLAFAYKTLDDHPGLIDPEGYQNTYTVDQVSRIISSAFGVQYHFKKSDHYKDVLKYNGGVFDFTGSGGEPVEFASAFEIAAISQNRVQVLFDVFNFGVGVDYYMGKIKAVLQKDAESIFGYRLVSFVSIKEKAPMFPYISASSYVKNQDGQTFDPQNACDKRIITSWATSGGIGEWITLSSLTYQDVTGMSIIAGDRSKDDTTVECSGQPAVIRVEFSNGESFERDIFAAEYLDSEFNITFGRKIHTKSIKITILQLYEDAKTHLVFISEIKPF